jgi:hypothetical protein
MARAPGTVRDSILRFLSSQDRKVSLAEIREAVSKELGDVPSSSVRSYLNLNPKIFERTSRGEYRLKKQ